MNRHLWVGHATGLNKRFPDLAAGSSGSQLSRRPADMQRLETLSAYKRFASGCRSMASRTTTNGLYRRPAFQMGPALEELPPPMASDDDLPTSRAMLTPMKEIGSPRSDVFYKVPSFQLGPDMGSLPPPQLESSTPGPPVPVLLTADQSAPADLSFKRFRATPGAERRGATSKSVAANAPACSGPHAPHVSGSSSSNAAQTSSSYVASPSPNTFASRTGADFLVGHRRDLSASTPALSTTSRDTEAGSISHLHTDVNYIPAPWRSPSPRDVRQRDLLEALMRDIEQTGSERGAWVDSDTYKWSSDSGYGGFAVLPRV